MHYLSSVSAISIAYDLATALHGCNAYGGHVAEIYLYRIQVNPSLNPLLNPLATIDQGCRTLYAVLAHFAENYDASVKVDGRRLGPWIRRARFNHRVHVEVRPKLVRRRKGDRRHAV